MSNEAIARKEAIYELMKINKGKEDITNLISRGFIPDILQSEYANLYNKYLESTKGQIDTDFDLSVFSNYFYLGNENKIIGKEVQGSGYINPIKTVGDINKIVDIVNVEVPKTEPNKKEKKKINVKGTISMKTNEAKRQQDLSMLSRINTSKTRKEQNKTETKSQLWTIEESLKFYSPNISEAEIKGHVYYKQKHGVPMIGWEKWFLPTNTPRGKFCVSNKAFHLKNQQFQDIKLVPSSAILGVKTKFKNEYSGELFWVIKDESGALYYASERNFIEKDSFATIDEVELIKLVQEKGLCYLDGEYIPIYLFTKGDLFELQNKLQGKFNRELDKYEGGQIFDIENKFGKEVAEWHSQLLKDAFKSIKIFDFADPVVNERPYLSKENEISETFEINELDIDCGVSIKKHYDAEDRNKRRYSSRTNYSDESKISIFEAFKIWFNSTVTDTMLDKTTTRDIRDYYFENRNVKIEKSDDKTTKDEQKEKDEKKILARQEGEKWYSEFLATALKRSDLSALNRIFNQMYNTNKKCDLDKVPVGFEANKNIFNKKIILKPVQRDGLAFMSLNNYGCLAYDVGYGKTLCAIHNLAILLKQGQIKRPLIAVPKQVYKNWIYEMFGCWTNGAERSEEKFEGAWFVNGALTGTKYKLNKWFNLGSGHEQPNKLVDEYSITLVTYQGLAKIGFSEKLFNELSAEIFTILNTTEGEKSRRTEKEAEKAEGLVGMALKKTEIDIDTVGFDYMVLDEAHAFKNIFSTFAIPEGYVNAWRIKGSMSNRGVKAFVLSLYLQKKYNGGVNLLTATPFTNSPFELFSMLSMVGYNLIAKSNINNVFKFLSMFIETQVEYTVDYRNKIELNTVIKSFKNKNILRDLLYSIFDYQDNPKLAGIKRPCKINYPNKQTSTFLAMSESQKEVQHLVEEEAENYDPKNNKGAVGRALSWAKSNSFSPYSTNLIEIYQDLEEFINESPKLKYTIECIKSVKEFHESKNQECSGQVIYSNRGKDLFPDFKKAIEKECGFQRKIKFGDDIVDEVEIITASNSDADADRKELIKDAFNEGFVKVIIGTATIQEGINLQKRGTVLYNLDLDWNPTAFKQLEGRIHRQQNMFKYVRIVVPMIQGTLDSFINQKLDEKSKRIASIWDKEDNINNVSVNDALDPMEIKYNLITDENQLLSMRLDIEKGKAKKTTTIKFEKFENFQKLQESIKDLENYKPEVLQGFKNTDNNINEYISYINRFITDKSKVDLPLSITDQNKVNDLLKKLDEIHSMFKEFNSSNDFKILSEIKRALNSRKLFCEIKQNEYKLFNIEYSSLVRLFDSSKYYTSRLDLTSSWDFDRLMGAYAQCKRYEKSVLKPYGLTFTQDFSNLKNELEKEYNDAKNFEEFIKSEEYKNGIINEVREELSKRQFDIGTLEDRVEGFKNQNCLLSYPFDETDSENCEIPDCSNDSDNDKYLQQSLEVDEYINIDDVSIKATYRKLSKIKDFICKPQLEIIRGNIPEFKEVINRLYEIIVNTPELYKSQDTKLEDKTTYLHYFKGSSDWFVFELDKKDVIDENNTIESPAFGFVCLNGDIEMSEMGYFDINELKMLDVELDFYFDPQPMSIAFPEKFEVKSDETPIQPSETSTKDKYQKKIDLYNSLLDFEDDKDLISDYKEKIELYKNLLDLE